MSKIYKRILVISDMHAPYGHADTVAFLKAIKNKYNPDKIISIGDEIDAASISFHTHDPDLLSPSDEFSAAIKKLNPIYKLFPKMDILESNHGSLVYRRGKAFGLPRHVFKSYREVIQAPKDWNWHHDLIVDTPNGKVYFHHALSSSVLKSSQATGMNTVFGHHHQSFSIEYWTSGYQTKWAMFVGCLINLKSMAFDYGKNNLKKPIIGCGMIIDGHPKLMKMELNRKNRWIGKLI